MNLKHAVQKRVRGYIKNIRVSGTFSLPLYVVELTEILSSVKFLLVSMKYTISYLTVRTHDAVTRPYSFATLHSYRPASNSLMLEMKRLPAEEKLYFIDFVNVRPSFFHFGYTNKMRKK